MSEEQDCWQMGQEQQLCSQKTHISTGWGCRWENSTGAALGQGEKRLFLTRGVRVLFPWTRRCTRDVKGQNKTADTFWPLFLMLKHRPSTGMTEEV